MPDNPWRPLADIVGHAYARARQEAAERFITVVLGPVEGRAITDGELDRLIEALRTAVAERPVHTLPPSHP